MVEEPVSVGAGPAAEKSMPEPETMAEVQETAPAEEPVQDTEWAAPAASSKKSKKDKKKKKGSKVLDLDLADEPTSSGVQTPAAVEDETFVPDNLVQEPAAAIATDRGLDMPANVAPSTADVEPTPVLATETIAEEPEVHVQETEPVVEASKPAVDVMDFMVAEEPEILPEPTTEVQDWATAEPEVIPEQPVEEAEWAIPAAASKKSKKDKKKKKGSKVVDSEPASGAMTPVVPAGDASASFLPAEPEVLEKAIEVEVAPVVDVPPPTEAEIPAHAVEDSPTSREIIKEAAATTAEPVAEPAMDGVASELPKEPEAEPEPAGDEWAPLPSKKSKKDKKKGKKAAASSIETADSGTSTPAVHEQEQPLADTVPATDPEVVASEDVQPVAAEEVAETAKDATAEEQEAPKVEDEFPEFLATTKKGKKDKKKKGKKLDTFVEEESSASLPDMPREEVVTESLPSDEPTTSRDLVDEPTPVEEVVTSRHVPVEVSPIDEPSASQDLPAEVSPIDEPSASKEINTAEEEWPATPAPAKKSKKDKKKKRNTFTLEDAPTPAEEEPMPSPAVDKDKDIAAMAEDLQPEISETVQPPTDKSAEVVADVDHLAKPTVEDVDLDVAAGNDSNTQETVEIHPAVSDAILNRTKSPSSGAEALLAGAAAAAVATIGLGLIDNPPVLYPEDAPSPKLLSAIASPVDESISRSIETATAADHLKHDIEHDDDLPSLKKTKTMEMEEGITSAREIAAEFLEKPAAPAGHDESSHGDALAKEALFDEPMQTPEPETDKRAQEPTEEEPIPRGRTSSRRASRELAASYLEATSHPHPQAEKEEPVGPVSVPVHTATTPTPMISKRQSRELAAEFMSSITYENIIREKKSIPSDLEKARMTPQRSVRELAAAFLERERVASPSPSSSKERTAVALAPTRKERTFSPMRTGSESPLKEDFERAATPLRRERSFMEEDEKELMKEIKRAVTPLRKEKSFKVEDEKQAEKEKAEIAAASAALTGGVALLARKFGGSGTSGTPIPTSPSVVESRKKGWEKQEGVIKKSDKGKEKEIVKVADADRGMPMDVDPIVSVARDVHPAETRDMDIDDKPPAMETTTRGVGLGLSDMPVTPKTPVSLGRQDSETIPRSIKEGAPLDKDRSKRRDRREKRETSPEPVQRAFSFPDDIADEEAFTRKELKTPTRSLDDEPVRGIPRVASITDFMRSVTNLAPVQEELSDEEPVKKETPRHSGSSARGHKNALLGAAAAVALASATTPKRDSHSPSLHRDRGDRDSGFGSDSPHVSRQLFLKPHDDDSHRDSGVHLRDSRDYQHDSDSHLKTTPAGAAVKKSSPLAGSSTTGKFASTGPDTTPRTPRTPEPEKLVVKKRTVSSKPDTLAAPSSSSAGATRSVSDSQSQRAYSTPRSTDPTQPRRVASNTSISRLRTPEPLGLRPDSPGAASLRSYTGTPPLRRVDKRVSGDLRSVSRSQQDLSASSQSSAAKEKAVAGAALVGAGVIAAAGAAALLSGGSSSTPATAADRNSTTTPVANEGRVRAKDMADVYDGYGEGRIGSPRSPTRPHSMRRRQSMQVLELESRLAQLTEENRQLAEARAHAEAGTSQRNSSVLADRDSEIESLKRMLQEANEVIERLKQTNEGLRSSTSAIAVKHHEEVRRLETLNLSTSRELESVRSTYSLHARALQEKDSEIAQLRAQLEASTAQIRELQKQILETSRPSPSTESDFLANHDVDYFDHRCQQLCAHVQQWVLRFSKFSDMRACRLTSEINDEKLIDRLDNAVLDGSDVDNYLADRVKRRDIFMSMTMTMIWEFVFVRYLFGMDREQRQKLKTLEKQLSEVGPTHAVRQWRAITLTLLARRPTFKKQRDQDTEAVVQTILAALSKILPPPSNLESQIQSQLRKVIREAVDLAIEMRCQRAEYAMLPPLQPEYDDNGELTETVAFNAALMNDRSVSNSSHDDSDAQARNEELEVAGATVRVVLFPLVVRKGDDIGRGEDEVVVCPAQVLVNGSHMRGGDSSVMDKGKGIRMVTPSSDAGGASLLARSTGTAPTEGGRDYYGRSPARERGQRGVTPASDLAKEEDQEEEEEDEEEDDEDTDMDDADHVQGARAKTAAYLEGRA
ncbi:hypothetical protein QBC37DRAFT_302227 [Rhypophila decipiens]|uniref:Involucrin repeat protein n=1 Tax=Rhypophila decipiens TaxID=261697 RepID=A0AAN6YJC4_9PEZI|nr:hypothetical protein QBC37DRAFT_302227 [Rhypophila decipiens]